MAPIFKPDKDHGTRRHHRPNTPKAKLGYGLGDDQGTRGRVAVKGGMKKQTVSNRLGKADIQDAVGRVYGGL